MIDTPYPSGYFDDMKCYHCGQELNMGKLMSTVKTMKKAMASRMNGMKGGKPKKNPLIMESKPSPWEDIIMKNQRCQASNCRNLATHKEDIDGFNAWLCDLHRSGTP